VLWYFADLPENRGSIHTHQVKEVFHAVAQLVEALRYKSEGRGFDSRWCHWNFSLTIFPAIL
jgi:hypothetical protein